jgi:two-component system, NtrC family, response regulator PilR
LRVTYEGEVSQVYKHRSPDRLHIKEQTVMARILLVDDEGSIVKVLGALLQVVGHYDVVSTQDGVEAARLLRSEEFDLMITDIRMSPMDGMQLLRLAHDICPNMVVIIVTAFGSIDTAIEAHDLGAFDYVPKPFKLNELLETVTMAIKYRDDLAKSAGGNPQVKVEYYLGSIVAESPAMRSVCDMIKRVVPADMPVLITGPKGSGKALVARTIHDHGQRSAKKFVSLTCRQTPALTLEADLFRAGGALETAHEGTLFLEDIDGLQPNIQTRLLEIMKEKKFKLAGSGKDMPADFRLIGSAIQPLDELLRKGLFMADLRKLPSRIAIEIPPLQDRPDDILPLANHFLKIQSHAKTEEETPKLASDTIKILTSYSWPGNADQLAEIVKRILTFARDGLIQADDLPPEIRDHKGDARSAAVACKDDAARAKGKNLMMFVRQKRREQLQKVVEESGGDRRKAAAALNLSLVELNRELNEAQD